MKAIAPLLACILSSLFLTGGDFALTARQEKTGPSATLAYKAGDGPLMPRVVRRFVLRDTERDKNLVIKLFFPVEDGVYPVVIISHGLGGSKDGHDPLGRFLASHGYVTIHPTHADSLLGGGFNGGRPLSDPAAWKNRVRDVTLIIDSLPLLARSVPGLKGKPDAKRIGVAGHSYGALTTMHLAGAVITFPDGSKHSFRDERPRAFLALSPQGHDAQLGLEPGSWDAIERPVMSMTGSLDTDRFGGTPLWRTIPFSEMRPGEKYLLWIEGAYHFTFTGKTQRRGYPDVDPREQEELFGYVRIAAVAFWDEHLKGIGAARRYLASDKIQRYSGGTATLQEK
jgi:predicted dienelactone hydrolase